jgi:hypothetical protein
MLTQHKKLLMATAKRFAVAPTTRPQLRKMKRNKRMKTQKRKKS